MFRNSTIRTFKPHIPLGGIKATMSPVGVVNQPHRGDFSHVLGRGQGGFFYERIVPSVDRNGRYPNLVKKILGAGRLVIVIFVLEAINAGDVSFVKGADRGAGADGVDVERSRKLFVF